MPAFHLSKGMWFLVLTCIGLTVVVFAAVLPQIQNARAAAAHSTASALYVALENSTNHVAITSYWRTLSIDEYTKIVHQIGQSVPLDAGAKRWTANGVLLDPWGNPFQIAIRKKSEGHVEYLVSSKGADGILGTQDDIVVPHRSTELPGQKGGQKGQTLILDGTGNSDVKGVNASQFTK
jgi:hypothetical protein